jgi:hypothetical protein
MKKIAAVFVAAMVVGGAAWAAPTDPTGGEGRKGIVNTGVSPTGSIERRSSAGMFSSDIDNFIKPRFYDSKIGTFLYAGANIPSDASRFDFGFAKSIGDLYLGFYYGGGLLDANGKLSPATTDPNTPKEVGTDKVNWDSDFALLLGVAGMGIRLDAHVPTNSVYDRNVGKDGNVEVDTTKTTVTYAPSFALAWGTQMGDLAPWARVGYRFADVTVWNDKKSDADKTGKDNYTRTAEKAAFELSGGAEYAMGEGAVGGALNVGITLPKVETLKKRPSGDKDQTNRQGGMLGVGLSAYYSRTFDFDSVKLGFSPNVGFALSQRSNSWAGDSGSGVAYGDIWTTLDLGVDMGITWQISQKAAVFTGATVNAFDWTTAAKTGKVKVGDKEVADKDSAWIINGVTINNPTIGLTYSPVENITVGLVLNDFIFGLFGGWTNPSFDFTVSAKL